MASLSLKHIYKVYPNGTKAVNDFNMEIDDKEFIVLVGPSGCGKSTTLRMIAGLEDITSGELKIGDDVVNGLEPKDRDIAMVFQNYALYPHMTIYENIAFGLQMRKVPKDEIDKRVKEVAEILGITEYLNRKPKEMSGGQRQRVALGRAIVRSPKIMLLDEPLSNLDAKLRTQMRSEIIKLHKKLQTTFIYVTHDQIEAMTMGTRIVVMKDGFIQQIDTPKNLYKYPSNKFVAGFIGTPQMNFFDCTLKRKDENVIVKFDSIESQFIVPYSSIQKISPEYLNGIKPVVIGLRAEDIYLNSEKSNDNDASFDIKIFHTEELGTETLVYGDIDINFNGFNESPTRIVIKAGGFQDFESGKIIKAFLNIDSIHIFDRETEENILPRIPEYNYIDCSVENNIINVLGEKEKLPSSINIADGEYKMLLNVSSFKTGGNIHGKITEAENISGINLATIDIEGKRIFAVLDNFSLGDIHLKIDFKKAIIQKDNKNIIEPLPMINSLEGKLVMEKIKAIDTKNGKKQAKNVNNYSIIINNSKFSVPDNIIEKIFTSLSNRKAFNSTYIFEFSPYNCYFSDEGIDAIIKEIINYGDEKFAHCITKNNEDIFVYFDGENPNSSKISINFNEVSIIEKNKQIKII